MSRNGKLVSTALLSVLALGCGVLAAYFLSILWWGEWKYPELILPISGAVIAEVLSLGGIALINRRKRGVAAVVWSIVLMTAGWCAVAAGLFFAVLSNCSLNCGNKIVNESQSPNGRWRAVLFLRNCAAAARYCPTVSDVSVLTSGTPLPGGVGNIFSIVTDGGITLGWKSNDLLLVRYPGRFRVMRQRERFGNVRVQYLPVGSM